MTAWLLIWVVLTVVYYRGANKDINDPPAAIIIGLYYSTMTTVVCLVGYALIRTVINGL